MDVHAERKLVISINYPKSTRIEVQRVSATKLCNKEMFLKMRAFYKQKFERDDVAVAKLCAEEEADLGHWEDLSQKTLTEERKSESQEVS